VSITVLSNLYGLSVAMGFPFAFIWCRMRHVCAAPLSAVFFPPTFQVDSSPSPAAHCLLQREFFCSVFGVFSAYPSLFSFVWHFFVLTGLSGSFFSLGSFEDAELLFPSASVATFT